MLVPSPAFRSMALGIMISVAFILAATLTLLPAVLGKLGPKVDRFALPWAHSGEHRSAKLRRLGRAALAPPGALRAAGPAGAPGAGRPGPRAEDRHALDQGGPLGRLLAAGLHPGLGGLRPRRPGHAAAGRPRGLHAPGGADRGRRSGHRAGHAAPAGRRRPRDGPGRADAPAPPPTPPARPSTGCAPTCRPGSWSAARRPRTTTWRPCSRPTRRSSSGSSWCSASCC